jgi:FAD/FMN-containing dehydrogenase
LAAGLLPNALELVNPPLSRVLHETFEPTIDVDAWSLAVGVDGPAQAVDRQLRDIEMVLRGAGAVSWWMRADDGRLWHALQSRFRTHDAEPSERAIIRVGTVRTQVGNILSRLTELGTHLSIQVELTARFGNGLIYGVLPLDAGPVQSAHISQTLAEMRGHLAVQRGYLVVESAPPAFKAQFDCWGDLGPQAEVMAGLKREFDPRRVLNPGRFIHHL